MDSSQIFGLVIVSITLIGGMAIALTAIKIAVPKSYDEKQQAMEIQARERIALIEKGIDPATIYKKEKKASGDPLFWGLLLTGIGFGAFYGNITWRSFNAISEVPLVNACATFFGGFGLILYYIIQKLSNRNKAQ